jgi:hypothetical protein
MADITTYEHSNGVTVALPSENLTIEVMKQISITRRADGAMLVHEVARWYKFGLTAILTAANYNAMIGYQHSATDYTGAYPRLTTTYLAGAVTLTNIEVACTVCRGTSMADGNWSVTLEFEEKTA